MERKPADVYIGAALVAGLVGILCMFFPATLFFWLIACAVWFWAALRLWHTQVAFGMVLGFLMFPPLIFLLFAQGKPAGKRF